MKLKFFFILITIIFSTVQYAKAADQISGNPVTIFEEVFSVPGNIKHKNGTPGHGVEKPFTLEKKSRVILTILSKKSKPSLNVLFFDAENYAKYQATDRLTNLTTIDSLSKKNTLGYEANAVLPAGSYVVMIRWAEFHLFTMAPAVGMRLISQDIVPIVHKPTVIPTKSLWKKIF